MKQNLVKFCALFGIMCLISSTAIADDKWIKKIDFANPPDSAVSMDANSCKYRLSGEFRLGFSFIKVYFLPRQIRNPDGPVTILFSIDAAEVRNLEGLTKYYGPDFDLNKALDNRATVPHTMDLNFTNIPLHRSTNKLGITLDMSYPYAEGRPRDFDGWNYMAGIQFLVGQTSGGSSLILEEACPPLQGDVNLDRKIDNADAQIILANLKQLPVLPVPISRQYSVYFGKTREQGDLDGNGMVDNIDYYIWAGAFARSTAK